MPAQSSVVKFRCKRSGNVIELKSQTDIDSMKDHPEYEEVKDGMQEKQETAQKKGTLRLNKQVNN